MPARKTAKNRDDDWNRRVGGRMKQQRVALNISQQQLGDVIAVSFQQIQKYESGQNAVPANFINPICNKLKMSPADLFEIGSPSEAVVYTGFSDRALKVAALVNSWPASVQTAVHRSLTELGNAFSPTPTTATAPPRNGRRLATSNPSTKE